MTDPIIEQARAVEAASAGDTESLQVFIRDFCQHDFWISAEVKDHVEGKDLVSFSFNQVEGVDLPVLMAFCRQPEGEAAKGRQAHSGLVLLSLAGKTRFHLVLINGEDNHTLPHDRLLLMLRLLELESGVKASTPQAEPDPMVFHQAAPPALTRAIYDYCRQSPDILQCRIGIASSPGQSLTLPDFMVMLEGMNLQVHREAISTLAARHMPPNQMLLMIDPEAGLDSHLNYAAVLKTFPPFYGKSQDQGLWARLKRRLNPPRVPWIQAEITPE